MVKGVHNELTSAVSGVTKGLRWCVGTKLNPEAAAISITAVPSVKCRKSCARACPMDL